MDTLVAALIRSDNENASDNDDYETASESASETALDRTTESSTCTISRLSDTSLKCCEFEMTSGLAIFSGTSYLGDMCDFRRKRTFYQEDAVLELPFVLLRGVVR